MNVRRLISILILMMVLLFHPDCSRTQKHPDNNSRNDINKKMKKIGEITDVFKAPDILVDDSQVYLWDKFLCKVRIYSKKALKKVAEFGKKGEGPSEFYKVINSVSLSNRFIYVSSFPKLICFSKDGEFVKEIRGRTPAGSYLAIGENFIGRRHIYQGLQSKKDKIAYVLFDSDLIRRKDIFETEFMKESTEINNSKMKVLWFGDCYKGVVYKDRFYVGSTDRGFFFTAFDADGNKLYEINKDYQRIMITDEFKETLFMRASKDEGFKHFISKREIVFPEYFPAYANFEVENDRIYVFKYPNNLSEGAILEVLILDLKGNYIEKTSLPAGFWYGFQSKSSYFYNGKLYFLKMSEKNENLEFIEFTL